MKYNYNTTGTCCRVINFLIENDHIYNIEFIGGCPGNLGMIAKLLNGMEVDKVINLCKGNLCGNKNTSCADQLAKALESIKVNI